MNNERAFILERIENYVTEKMSPEERAGFENELNQNAELNEYFQLYRTIDTEMRETERYTGEESAVRNTLSTLNLHFFKPAAKVVPMRSPWKWYRMAMSAAAVLVLVLTAYFFLIQKPSHPRQLAHLYVTEELSQLSLTMDGGKDSLQQGMAAYNNKEYARALEIFNALYKTHPENTDALKNAGITYLTTGKYSQALACFDELAAKKDLFSNPGLFLKAVTLMERNEGDDVQKAELLLKRVIDEKQEGSVEAARWLKK